MEGRGSGSVWPCQRGEVGATFGTHTAGRSASASSVEVAGRRLDGERGNDLAGACPPRALTGGHSRSLNVAHAQHADRLTWDDARSRRSRRRLKGPYKAEDGGSSPSAPTSTDNILRGCDVPGEGWAELEVRQKSVGGSKCSEGSRLWVATPAERCVRTSPRLQGDGLRCVAGPAVSLEGEVQVSSDGGEWTGFEPLVWCEPGSSSWSAVEDWDEVTFGDAHPRW